MKKYLFYVGAIVSVLLCLVPQTKNFASGISLLLGILFVSFFHIFVPRNTQKIRKFTLNTAVVLFGFGLSVSNVISIGSKGLLQTALSIGTILLAGFFLSKIFKLNPKISQLITFGTSICGGSAIAAISPVIDADNEEIAVSTAVIFLLNTVALFLFIFLIGYLELTAEQVGTWAALSIHDTSSVVSSASFHSNEALKFATIMKLTRTLWIIPMVVSLCLINKTHDKISFPIFILYFIGATIFSSLFDFPNLYHFLTLFGKILLSLALYFIGTSLNLNTLRKISGKNLLFALSLWIISIISGYFIMVWV